MGIQDLLVKSAELGEAAIEKILRPYARFVANGELSFNAGFFDLRANDKIGVALIAKDSWRYVEGKEAFSGGMKNEELEKTTLLPGNTVRPAIKTLRDKGLVRPEKDVHHPTAKLIMMLQQKFQKK